jgi:hypothetical protein
MPACDVCRILADEELASATLIANSSLENGTAERNGGYPAVPERSLFK